MKILTYVLALAFCCNFASGCNEDSTIKNGNSNMKAPSSTIAIGDDWNVTQGVLKLHDLSLVKDESAYATPKSTQRFTVGLNSAGDALFLVASVQKLDAMYWYRNWLEESAMSKSKRKGHLDYIERYDVSSEVLASAVPLKKNWRKDDLTYFQPETVESGDLLDVYVEGFIESSEGDAKDKSNDFPPCCGKPIFVKSDGSFHIPYLGKILASGMTVEQIEGVIAEKFRSKIPAPDVLVDILRKGQSNNE